MYDMDGIDNINNNKVKHKKDRGLKIMAAVFCLATIISLCGLAYVSTSFSGRVNKLEQEAKTSKEELKKANETVSKYETATGTKAVETEVENTKIKEIVKPMAVDTKIGDLVDMIDREQRGKMKGENSEGMPIVDSWPIISFKEIFTNKDATYLIANMYIRGEYMVITNKETGAKRVEGAGGGDVALDYRALPDGEWKQAYAGNGFPDCNSFSDETKRVFKDLRIKDGKSMLYCWDPNVKENSGVVKI